MAAKLTDRSSIPAVVAELTLEEKAHLLTGASSFTTYAVERLGIPSCTVLDGGTGINFQQYWGDVYSRALKRDSGKNNLSLSGISNSAKVMPILDKLESDIPLTDEEQKVADYIRKEMKDVWEATIKKTQCCLVQRGIPKLFTTAAAPSAVRWMPTKLIWCSALRT